MDAMRHDGSSREHTCRFVNSCIRLVLWKELANPCNFIMVLAQMRLYESISFTRDFPDFHHQPHRTGAGKPRGENVSKPTTIGAVPSLEEPETSSEGLG